MNGLYRLTIRTSSLRHWTDRFCKTSLHNTLNSLYGPPQLCRGTFPSILPIPFKLKCSVHLSMKMHTPTYVRIGLCCGSRKDSGYSMTIGWLLQRYPECLTRVRILYSCMLCCIGITTVELPFKPIQPYYYFGYCCQYDITQSDIPSVDNASLVAIRSSASSTPSISGASP